MTPTQSKQIVAALAEVLPSDKFNVLDGPGMGYDGVMVQSIDIDISWYFDNTYGGDDGFTDHLRIYKNVGNDCHDDLMPDNAPADKADPVTIAKWIVTVVTAGSPAE